MAPNRTCWLMKSEPDVFSIDDLERLGRAPWDGVRNYQARNFMRDDMRLGDLVLFYHSNAAPPGVAGVARICREAYPDHTAWDPESTYYDPRSTPEHPVWLMVDVEWVETFSHFVSLNELKHDKELTGLMVTRRGVRLSVQPVKPSHFRRIRAMGRSRRQR